MRSVRVERRAPVPAPVQVVHVRGEVDRATAPTLAAGLAWAQIASRPPRSGADGGLRRVVVDVAGMTFCSVAGMAALVDAADIATTRGTVWALAGLPPRLSTLISALWPGRHPIGYPDRDIAIAAVGLGPPWPWWSDPPRPDPLPARRPPPPQPVSRGLS